MTRPTVSVIIPCHQAERTIGATVRSVLAQSFEDFELIVVDDGSRDGSVVEAERTAGGDSRLWLVRQPNCGVSATRNRAAGMARGELLAFLDADDLWRPDTLALHVDHLRRRPRAGVSFARVRYLDAEGRSLARVSAPPLRPLTAADLLAGNPTITASNIVTRREVFREVGGFDEAMSFAEDLEWLARVRLTTRWTIEGIDETLVGYRASPAGLSSRVERMEAGWEMVAERLRSLEPELVAERYAAAKTRQLCYLARQTMRTGGSVRAAAALLRRAWKTDPSTVRRLVAGTLFRQLPAAITRRLPVPAEV